MQNSLPSVRDNSRARMAEAQGLRRRGMGD